MFNFANLSSVHAFLRRSNHNSRMKDEFTFNEERRVLHLSHRLKIIVRQCFQPILEYHDILQMSKRH